MRIPVIRGIIDRHILANVRVAPEVLAHLLPPPFRPHTVNGFGIAGVCLIHLKHVRPRFLPPLCGFSSENAAHRIAVEWDADGQLCRGVFIPRRDTSSLLSAFTGGRIPPPAYTIVPTLMSVKVKGNSTSRWTAWMVALVSPLIVRLRLIFLRTRSSRLWKMSPASSSLALWVTPRSVQRQL